MYTILQAKKTIQEGIQAYLRKDEQGNYIMDPINCLPFYLEGAPGIGKTQIVKQIASKMNLGFVSFSLVHHTRNSLLGLPVIKELENGEKYTNYTMSEIIASVNEEIEKGYREGILLLDEFPCMSETIMPAMLAFLQTRNIGNHALERGWIIVLCGNPVYYNHSSKSFDAAIADRIRKIEINYDIKDFFQYANENQLSDCIIRYLELHPDDLYRYQKSKNNVEIVTCRSWDNLSHALMQNEALGFLIDDEFIKQFLKSDEIAIKFAEFYNLQLCGIDVSEVKKILNRKLTPEIIKKYQNYSFSLKWKVLGYLRRFLDQDSRQLETIAGYLKYKKKVLSLLERGFHNEMQQFFTKLNRIDKTDEASLKAISRELLQQIQYFEQSDEQSETEEIIPKLIPLLKEWKNAFTEMEYKDMENYIEKLETWSAETVKKQEKLVKRLGIAIGGIFEFLEAIDENDELAERFYMDICNTPGLIQSVYFTDCPSFKRMCCKQYGINQN